MRSRLAVVALLSLCVPLLACLVDDSDAPDPLGELHGTYAVTGHIDANECGAGVPALDPLSFAVELRYQGGAAIWRREGSPLVYGTVSADGTWEIQGSVVQGVYDPDPVTGHPGCALTQTETIVLEGEPLPQDAGTLDAGAPDAGTTPDVGAPDAGESVAPGPMVGRTEIRFVPTTGSDCTPTLAAYGGPFSTLPCSVSYELQAEPTEPIF